MPLQARRLQLANYTLTSSSSGFQIDVFDFSPDEVAFVSSDVSVVGSLSSPAASAFFQLQLIDSTESALGSDALASVPFELASWDAAPVFFQITSSNGDVFNGTGTIESMNAVPEPSTLLLLSSGMLLLRIARGLAARGR